MRKEATATECRVGRIRTDDKADKAVIRQKLSTVAFTNETAVRALALTLAPGTLT